jgi:hypothetical protein
VDFNVFSLKGALEGVIEPAGSNENIAVSMTLLPELAIGLVEFVAAGS